MTTFTTKNQSRKRYYRALGAALIIIILVSFIILSRRDRNQVSNSSSSSSSNSQRDSRNRNGASSGDKRRPAFYNEDIVEYEPSVMLQGQEIKGQVRTVYKEKMVASYLGVPYAEVPIDERRFSPPQLKQFKTNSTVLEASSQPFKCYQSSFVLSITEMKSLGEESREDCLYLNIWAPFQEECDDCNKTTTPTTKPTLKPVMIFIHSGLFQFGGIGSPDLDPSQLVAQKDIVAITIQYRLGMFGFGSTEEDINKDKFQSLGLQDQAKALEWVKKNIKAFGGNPDQITLSGHGAGAISIGFHLLNTQTNKLFKRAILQGIQNIWNIGMYGINDKSVRFLMEDSNCDEQTVRARNAKECMKKDGIQAIVFLEGQQYLIDTFPVPFVPDYIPLTKEIAEQTKSMVPDARFNDTLLGKMFTKWNIFSPNHEIMIGLNSDDDYQFEKINKITTKVHFGDHDADEDEDYETDEEGEEEGEAADTGKNNEETEGEETEGDEEKPTANDKEDENNTNTTKTNDNEEEEANDDNDAESRSDTSDENENEENDTTSSTVTPTTMSTMDGSLQQKRRRRQTEVIESKLDKDEKIKLCRLVQMYHIQQKLATVSPRVAIYRLDPKVLVNLLEEVSFAFGAKANWLDGLDREAMNLWGSFVTNGMTGLQESSEIYSQYDSNISSDKGPVKMINIGQMGEDENRSQVTITQFDWKTICPVQS